MWPSCCGCPLTCSKLCRQFSFIQLALVNCLSCEFVSNNIGSVYLDEILAGHVMEISRNAENIDEAMCELEWSALQKGCLAR